MGTFSMLAIIASTSLALCFVYSALDLKVGERGFLCWGAFSVLTTTLSGGPIYSALSLAVLAGGKAAALEPLAVLAVSCIASSVLCSYLFSREVDDTQVAQKPHEQEIREILFQIDPTKLHLVDGELLKYQGREKDLLRRYQGELNEFKQRQKQDVQKHRLRPERNSKEPSPSHGGRGSRDAPIAKSVLQDAHEEEVQRVQEAIRARVEALTAKVKKRSTPF